MDQEQPKRIRRYASTLGILILLAAVLGFYYFKYVPERRTEYNQAAFLELTQIEHALQNQDGAYNNALQNIIHHDKIDSLAFDKFNLQVADSQKLEGCKNVGSGRFNFVDALGNWQLLYPVYDHLPKNDQDTVRPKYTLSKNADILMNSIVSTYKDIFDDYLLIDNQKEIDGEYDKGKIIFQSDDLYMNDRAEPDSFLKKNDGFSLNNLQDITIGGNAYKVFLYPFEMGSQNLVLVGLISDSKYRETNLKIPFSFFSVFIVMVLLLLIHLPILRIYILGPSERIRERDIRLIIGSYFVAAFFGFFIFTKIFLNKEQAVQNKNNIKTISNKIIGNFQTELDLINRQLCSFDSILIKLTKTGDSIYLNSMNAPPNSKTSINHLDALFKPQIYPYPNIVFWISDGGQWVARWGFKDALTKSSMINVADRLYFKDFKNNEALSIKGVDGLITIQPTLSKLEGEYVVTVAKKSTVQDSIAGVKPFLIGMATEMRAVYNVVMPPGYNFSIIDKSGDILFDSKPGRPLLSNIYKEMESPERVQQSALYRNKRYFETLRLRSKDMSLLSRPIDGTPYQLLVYYNKSRSDDFEEHLITLSSVLIGAVICLVIFSSLINRWSKDKNRMLESRSHHFEWLYPSNNFFKQRYYLHLIQWMLLISGVYLLAWIFLEVLPSRSEFSFLFISLLFPFYIAVFYYELRERYYDVQERKTDVDWYYARPSIALRGSLLIIIILINCFTSFVQFSWSLALPVLITQVIWGFMIMVSTIRFRYFMMRVKNPVDSDSMNSDDKKKSPIYKFVLAPIRSFLISISKPIRKAIFVIATYQRGKHKTKNKIPNSPESKIPNSPKEKRIHYKRRKTNSTYSTSTSFIWAILISVTLVSVVPAFGLFWLFYRQEKGLYLHTDQLIMSKEIDDRSQAINQHIKDFKYKPYDSIDRSNISKLKFSDGIYTISGRVIADCTKTGRSPFAYPTKEFIQLHDQFFRNDSLVLDWTKPTYRAADSTWYFVEQEAKDFSGPELLYSKRKDGINPGAFRLTSNPNACWNTTSFIGHSFSGMGTAFSIFFIVGLCFSLAIAYFLTLSLARRIFLVELQQVVGEDKNNRKHASKLYEESGIQPAMRSMILGTSKQPPDDTPGSSPNEVKKDDSWEPELHDICLFEKKLPLYQLEAMMPSLINTLEPVYYNLWNKLSAQHKFILFDFAQDGFANYKAGRDLQALIDKGLLFFEDQRLNVMTLSFQEYILQQKDDPELNTFLSKAKKDNTWNKIQTPLLVLLMAAGVFIFATQEEVYKKITGLLATISSLLPLLTGMFGKSSGKSADS
jgi:cbb3-type cytochrome oxidase subunit 3